MSSWRTTLQTLPVVLLPATSPLALGMCDGMMGVPKAVDPSLTARDLREHQMPYKR